MSKRNRILALLLSVLILLPTTAFAQTWTNFTITVMGKPIVVQVPIQKSPGTQVYTTKVTFKLVNRDGKWVLENTNPGVNPSPPKTEKPLPPEKVEPNPPKPQDPTPSEEKGLTQDEAKMVELVNAERVKAGLPALKVDMRLVELGRKKSKDMVDNGYFSHTSPNFGSPFDMMKAAGITYRYAGENLAGASKVDTAHVNLMNSPGHRANILNANFDHIGIGIVEGSPYGKIYTQMFIGTR